VAAEDQLILWDQISIRDMPTGTTLLLVLENVVEPTPTVFRLPYWLAAWNGRIL
jgi:hypothetical protein